MNKLLLIIYLTVIFLATSAQVPDLNLVDKIAYQKSKNFIQKSSFNENQTYAETDFIYQRMEWVIDPNVEYISGKITTYLKSRIDGLSKTEFDLITTMTVDSIKSGNQKLNFTRNENKINIPLATELNKGEIDSVVIWYQGKPEESGFGAFSKGEHNGVPIIWTLSEPYGAMEWWPCKQSLADKIDSVDIIVTSPEPYRTASNGVLISEKIVNKKRVMHWKHRFPIATYLVAIAVTNYTDYSDFLDLGDGRQIEILNYVYPESENDAKTKTPVTAEIMNLFNTLIGEYPFASEKYGHAQFGWGGGMEHQTMSFMTNFSFGLIAHELAHQWFGDYITLGSWHEIWLNEGFATYLAGLTYEHLQNGYWWPTWKKLTVERITSKPDGSVFVQDTTDVGRIFNGRLSYSKGAYVLHMLRWILGDEDFYAAIRNYYNDPNIANGFALTSQLIEHFEQAGDTSLTEYFNDWYYGEGYPVYSATFYQHSKNELVLMLSQNTSHQSVGFFEMPVPVRAYNSDKTDSIDFRLNHTENNQQFILNPEFEVAEISIDPDYWLVSKTGTIVNATEYKEPDDILVFPNPFIDNITILTDSGDKIQTVKIYSPHGKLILNSESRQSIFGLSHLTSGTYLMQINTSQNTFLQKIVKQ
ncbi:MAG: M1 family aminopeptidase [Bacteroidota bacterium]